MLLGGGTATNLALQTAYNILRNAQSQADSNQANDPQIVILLTDGHSNGGVSYLRSIVDTIKRNIKGTSNLPTNHPTNKQPTQTRPNPGQLSPTQPKPT